ncbi:MAG: heavy metal-associated domain-containing protein [Microcella sp.]|uniref:heavy-metal-associated domain-containing protein n=1 Tax=Microcella sp. TaxID=1913979 RepID=UPI003314E830
MDTTGMPQNSLNLLGDQSAAGGCCGGGACMCGHGGSDASAATASTSASAEAGMANGGAPGSLAVEYLVTGMTCGHCVSSVKEEVGAIDGVDAVEVVLKKDGASRVTVRSSTSISPEKVRAAVDEAGYALL